MRKIGSTLRNLAYGMPLAASLITSDAYAQGNAIGNTALINQQPTKTVTQTPAHLTSRSYIATPSDAHLLVRNQNDIKNVANINAKTEYKFDFTSNQPIRYSVSDAKKSIDSVVNVHTDKFYFWGSQGSKFREYLKGAADIVEPSDSTSLIRLNAALKDGILQPREVFANGKYQIREGNYWVNVNSGNQRKGMLVYVDLPGTPTQEEYNLPAPRTAGAAQTKQAPTKTKAVTKAPTKVPTKVSTKAPAVSTVPSQLPVAKDRPSARPQPQNVDLRKYADSVKKAYADSLRAKTYSDSVNARDMARERLRQRQDSVAKYVSDSIETAARADRTARATIDSLQIASTVDSIFREDSVRRSNAKPSGTDTLTKKVKDHAFRINADIIYPVSDDMRLKGGAIGLQYGIFAAGLNVSTVPDSTTRDLTVNLSNGRQGIGKEKNVDYKSLGVSVELHSPWKYIPVFIGGGANTALYETEKTERIVNAQGNDLRPPVIESNAESENSYRYFAGIQLNGSRFGLRAAYGKDTERGKFAQAGISVRVNKKQKK